MTKSVNAPELFRLAWSGSDSDGGVRRTRKAAIKQILSIVKDYPEQWNAVRAACKSSQIAIQANRRAGKSIGFMRWILARCVKRDDYVVRILTSVLSAPTTNFLDSGRGSMMDLIRECGLEEYVVLGKAAGSIKRIKFDWGSEIIIEDVGTIHAIERKRGFKADIYWVDEAQSIPLLPKVYIDLIIPTMGESDECTIVFTGTPGRAVDTKFYQVATGDDPAWTVIRFFSWDNPHHGPTDEARWAHICKRVIRLAALQYGLSDTDLERIEGLTREQRVAIALGVESDDLKEWVKHLDPSLLREIFGRWVRGGAEYVFRWYDAPDLYWGRVSDCMYDTDDELQVLADSIAGRIDQLPKRQVMHNWYPYTWDAVIGCDPGTEGGRSGSAFVVIVWNRFVESAIVLWAEKQEKYHLGQTLDRLVEIGSELQENGIRLHGVVGDFVTTGVNGRQWSEQYDSRLPSTIWLRPPAKSGKSEQIDICNLDLVGDRVKVVAGDALDIEGRNLRWVAYDMANPKNPEIHKWRSVTHPNSETTIPGDHLLDAYRYGAQECLHLFQEKPIDLAALNRTPAEHAQDRSERAEGLR